MKWKFWLLLLIPILVLGNSCHKNEDTSIDCTSEAKNVSIQHTTDPTNSKKWTFTLQYTGAYGVTSVAWQFGDGSSQTVNQIPIQHSYLSAGNYTVKAAVQIVNGGAYCIFNLQEAIVVN